MSFISYNMNVSAIVTCMQVSRFLYLNEAKGGGGGGYSFTCSNEIKYLVSPNLNKI